LRFFGDHAALADRREFKRFLAPLRKIEWVVYTKNPFAGRPTTAVSSPQLGMQEINMSAI
jgi:hypothetical protein